MTKPKVEKQQPRPPKPFIVKGRVTYADGKPLVRATVRAFDRDLRSEEALGDATTDRAGRYEIRYSAAQFRRDEKGSAHHPENGYSQLYQV